jgi:hypothetical protein
MRSVLPAILHAANFDRLSWIYISLKPERRVSCYGRKHGRLDCARRKSLPIFAFIRAPAKTKVWGSANQYDIQINLRRMEQFVLVILCCHSWLEPVAANRRLQ